MASQFAPCPQCKRHVRVAAASCPFCATTLSGLRPRSVLPRALTRAAIFSAALAGCHDKKPPPPTAGSAIESGSSNSAPVAGDATSGPGSDLGSATGSANAFVPADAAATTDAGDVADAGTGSGSDAHAAAIKNARDQKIKALREEHRHLAKPYGAPPARRRIV